MRYRLIGVLLTSVVLSLTLLQGDLSSGAGPEGPVAGATTTAAFAGAEPGSAPHAGQDASEPRVTLRAASGATLQFKTQNGEVVDGVPPETLDVPHLVLHRNGALTDPLERTLFVEVSGIELPPSGATVTLSVETQHGDPDLGGDPSPGIPAWHASQWMANSTGITQTGVSVVLAHEFDATVVSGTDATATPTDYFRYDLVVTSPQAWVTGPLHTIRKDHAFLMENQWIVPLPEVQEHAAGAAPDELIVYYCDMFPFRKDVRDATTWLPREDVTRYVRSELIPAMVEAFRVQTDEWGFPWYEEWTSYRTDAGAERLSVALSEGQTWFHGKAPGQGNAGISINVNGGKVEYEALTDGLMSTFHHELFHNQQRNIYLHHGGKGGVGGAESVWDLFAEGTAVLASSVGQPEVQFHRTWGVRAYISNARGFMGREGFGGGDLNRSYERMNGYHAVAYWRFLYEQCGGIADGVEDAAAGMTIIRQALVALYRGDVVDIEDSTDLVEHTPAIMNRALGSASCPFNTYKESLQAFARAIYALRLEGGRCSGPDAFAGCGFNDPEYLYHDPPIRTITCAGSEVACTAAAPGSPAGIPSSFGMDFVDVALDPSLDGRSLTIEFYGAPGAEAEFAVQILSLMDSGDGSRPRPTAVQAAAPVITTTTNPDGHLLYTIAEIDTAEFNRLALVITRVDTRERSDQKGAYSVVLHP